MEEEKQEKGGGNIYINMTGGIFIRNIEHVEHLHAVPEKEEKEEVAACEEAEVKLTVEDEEMLLPIFKGSRENLQQFFAEVKGLGPTRITAQVNRWIVDGRINKMNMKNLWRILKEKEIYTRTYQAWNVQVK